MYTVPRADRGSEPDGRPRRAIGRQSFTDEVCLVVRRARDDAQYATSMRKFLMISSPPRRGFSSPSRGCLAVHLPRLHAHIFPRPPSLSPTLARAFLPPFPFALDSNLPRASSGIDARSSVVRRPRRERDGGVSRGAQRPRRRLPLLRRAQRVSTPLDEMLDDPRAPRSNLVEKRSNATRVEVRIALADAEEQGALGRERENLGVAARVARPRRVERVGEERAREDAVASFGVRAHLRGDSRGDARAVGVSRENPARHAGEGGVSLGGRERARARIAGGRAPRAIAW